jgi:hypothetical protein
MSTISQFVVAIVVGGVAGIVLGLLAWRRLRTQQLRAEFGAEYDRAVERHGSRAKAERELLTRRRRRRRELGVRTLSPEVRDRYRGDWVRIQDGFARDPARAVGQADDLVTTVLGDHGYPAGDFEERIAAIRDEHGTILDAYRRAHKITTLARHQEASAEDLRWGMADYRAMFEELLPAATAPARNRPAPPRPP